MICFGGGVSPARLPGDRVFFDKDIALDSPSAFSERLCARAVRHRAFHRMIRSVGSALGRVHSSAIPRAYQFSLVFRKLTMTCEEHDARERDE